MEIEIKCRNTMITKYVSDDINIYELHSEFQDMIKGIGYSIPDDINCSEHVYKCDEKECYN